MELNAGTAVISLSISFAFDMLGAVLGYWLGCDTQSDQRLSAAELWKGGLFTAIGMFPLKMALGAAAAAAQGAYGPATAAFVTQWYIVPFVLFLCFGALIIVIIWAFQLENIAEAFKVAIAAFGSQLIVLFIIAFVLGGLVHMTH